MNILVAALIISLPGLWVTVLIKSKNKKEKKDEICALAAWSIAAIPTGIMFLMTIIFDLPPEGYGPMDIFR